MDVHEEVGEVQTRFRAAKDHVQTNRIQASEEKEGVRDNAFEWQGDAVPLLDTLLSEEVCNTCANSLGPIRSRILSGSPPVPTFTGRRGVDARTGSEACNESLAIGCFAALACTQPRLEPTGERLAVDRETIAQAREQGRHLPEVQAQAHLRRAHVSEWFWARSFLGTPGGNVH